MSLDDLFMPPIRIDGARVRLEQPLGGWGESQPLDEQERQERRRASWAAYAARNRAKRNAAVREWRQRRKAA